MEQLKQALKTTFNKVTTAAEDTAYGLYFPSMDGGKKAALNVTACLGAGLLLVARGSFDVALGGLMIGMVAHELHKAGRDIRLGVERRNPALRR
jgi:hypothetical protein